jgi:hypothetical protein
MRDDDDDELTAAEAEIANHIMALIASMPVAERKRFAELRGHTLADLDETVTNWRMSRS